MHAILFECESCAVYALHSTDATTNQTKNVCIQNVTISEIYGIYLPIISILDQLNWKKNKLLNKNSINPMRYFKMEFKLIRGNLKKKTILFDDDKWLIETYIHDAGLQLVQ